LRCAEAPPICGSKRRLHTAAGWSSPRFDRGRCLVAASWFYEFRGAKAPKEKWKFTKTGEEWFCFAGL
jgi:putative SOS response-associated peptidase YedK